MTAEHAASPLPRPVTRTGWVALAGVAVLLAAVFPLVLRSYEAEGAACRSLAPRRPRRVPG